LHGGTPQPIFIRASGIVNQKGMEAIGTGISHKGTKGRQEITKKNRCLPWCSPAFPWCLCVKLFVRSPGGPGTI
jgi:hypothetical protein